MRRSHDHVSDLLRDLVPERLNRVASVNVMRNHRGLGITGLQRCQDEPVLSFDSDAVRLTSKVDSPIDIGGVPQVMEQSDKPRHSGFVEDSEVELPIGQSQPGEISFI